MPKNYADLTDIDKRFDEYLVLVELKKDELSQVQLQELERAFMGGLGSALVLLLQDMDGLNEVEQINSLWLVMQKVSDFWSKQACTPFPLLNLG